MLWKAIVKFTSFWRNRVTQYLITNKYSKDFERLDRKQRPMYEYLIISFINGNNRTYCNFTSIFQIDCGQVFDQSQSSSGTFTSPNFPRHYGNLMQCTWGFRPEPGKFLTNTLNSEYLPVRQILFSFRLFLMGIKLLLQQVSIPVGCVLVGYRNLNWILMICHIQPRVKNDRNILTFQNEEIFRQLDESH